MTNKEAIEILYYHKHHIVAGSDEDIAIDFAISALERDGTIDYHNPATSVYACPRCGAVWKRGTTNDE